MTSELSNGADLTLVNKKPANVVYNHVHSGFLSQDFKNRLFLRLQFWDEIQELQNVLFKNLLYIK